VHGKLLQEVKGKGEYPKGLSDESEAQLQRGRFLRKKPPLLDSLVMGGCIGNLLLCNKPS
jgi:hypothetical protein